MTSARNCQPVLPEFPGAVSRIEDSVDEILITIFGTPDLGVVDEEELTLAEVQAWQQRLGLVLLNPFLISL